MRNLLLKTILVGAALLPSVAYAGPGDAARSQLTRLHVRLTRDAMARPEIEEARRATIQAYNTLYQVRENILVEVRKTDEYGDLKLALWHQQRQLDGLHVEIPVKILSILATATDSLAIRSQINKLETTALEASDDYLAARDEANARFAEYQRLLREALESVRNNPEFMAMSEQVRAASSSRTVARGGVVAR